MAGLTHSLKRGSHSGLGGSGVTESQGERAAFCYGKAELNERHSGQTRGSGPDGLQDGHDPAPELDAPLILESMRIAG